MTYWRILTILIPHFIVHFKFTLSECLDENGFIVIVGNIPVHEWDWKFIVIVQSTEAVKYSIQVLINKLHLQLR